MRTFVTGATGYVGSHLTREFVRKGWEVHVLIRPASHLQKLKDIHSRIVIHRHDATTEGMASILRQASPDIIFHLASRVVVNHDVRDIEDIIQANILLGTQILEGMRLTHCRCFVNTGSHWQHLEGETYNPVNLYAASKQAFGDILRYYVRSYAIHAITLKLFNVYGPGDTRNKLFHLFQKNGESGEPLALSPGDQYLDFVYIDDVVEAFCHAVGLLYPKPRADLEESYAVTSSRPIKLKDVVEIYERAAGKKLNLQWGGRGYRFREVMVPWKGTPLPGWKTRTDLEAGIRRMLATNGTSV